MTERGNPRENQRESWAALKAAHEEFQIASATLESQIALEEDDDFEFVTARAFRAQQLAFERYIEARMAFLDCCFDQAHPWALVRNPPPEAADHPPHKKQYLGIPWPPFPMATPVLGGLLFVLLCVTAVSAIMQQRHTHSLQTAFNDLQARFDKVQETLASKGDTLVAVRGPEPVQTRPDRAPRDPQATVRKRIKSRTSQGGAQRATAKKPANNAFTLLPSRQFKRVGPIRIALNSIDPKRQSVDLSIVSNFDRLGVSHLKTGQPVWIPLGDREKPIEVVIDRIGPTGLSGHLRESRFPKPQLRAGKPMLNSAGRSTE